MLGRSVMKDYFVELMTHNEVYSCVDDVLYCWLSVYYRFIKDTLLVIKTMCFPVYFLTFTGI